MESSNVSRNKLVRFNPKTYHSVVPWKGDRWSITAYVNRAVPKLRSDEVSKASKLRIQHL